MADTDLARALDDALSRLEDRAAPLCVAFSGGPDSSAVLHALAGLSRARELGLRALHVDHGLHPDSARWADHCLAFCDSLDVAARVLRVQVSNDSGTGLEAAAREARYAALASALQDEEILVAAHHRDDQAETFLLRALRGAGTDGLRAMRTWRRLGAGVLWRPLLDRPRSELLAHIEHHRLQVIDDPANRDPRHERSWLRTELMPLLQRRWPTAGAALARSAALCGEAALLLGDEDAKALASAQGVDPHSLRVASLTSLPRPRRARVLRCWIARLGLPPLPGHAFEIIERDLLDARPDAQAEFAWAGAALRRWRGVLHAGLDRPKLPADFQAAWSGRSPLRLPTGDTLVIEPIEPITDAATGDFLVRARGGGERIVLPGRTHSHALKHVLQDLGVPPWERERLPLLFDAGGDLLAAGDMALSAGMRAWLDARGARLRLIVAT